MSKPSTSYTDSQHRAHCQGGRQYSGDNVVEWAYIGRVIHSGYPTGVQEGGGLSEQ
jgi:hypothetical protein